MVAETLGVLDLEENLSDVERPPDITPGNYIGEVQSVEEKQSDKGNTYYAVLFKIASDEIPADIREHYEDGLTIGWNRTLVPKKGDRRALYNVKKLIENLGLDTNTTQIDPNEWMGRQSMLNIGLGSPYQGERRPEIKSLSPVEGGQAEREPAPKKTIVKKAAKRK
jgi:hypothetical protein